MASYSASAGALPASTCKHAPRAPLSFAQAAKAVGPNLTRDRLMATLDNGTVWKSDASLDQRFSYVNSERFGDNWDHNMGQGREFINCRCIRGPHFLVEVGLVKQIKPEHIDPAFFFNEGED